MPLLVKVLYHMIPLSSVSDIHDGTGEEKDGAGGRTLQTPKDQVRQVHARAALPEQ